MKKPFRVGILTLSLFLVTGTLFQNCSLNKLTSASSVKSSDGILPIIPPPERGASVCQFNSDIIQGGQVILAYQASSVPSGFICQSETRTCTNGSLSGSFQFSSCVVNVLPTEPVKKSCLFNGTTLVHGQSVIVYQSPSVTVPAACQSQARTCDDGVLSGGYTFSSCVVNSAPPIDPPITAGSRGCTDDPNVPVVDEIDFATRQPFGDINLQKKYVMSTVGDSQANAIAPSVIAVRLKVVPGGGLWTDGGAQIGPTRGSSTAEAVISRCRGRFESGGRVKVIRLDGYSGPGNSSPITFFAAWWVDPVGAPGIYTAILNAPGKTSPDGWLSDGVYYVNIRQTSCTGGLDGVMGLCERGFAGTGVHLQH